MPPLEAGITEGLGDADEEEGAGGMPPAEEDEGAGLLLVGAAGANSATAACRFTAEDAEVRPSSPSPFFWVTLRPWMTVSELGSAALPVCGWWHG